MSTEPVDPTESLRGPSDPQEIARRHQADLIEDARLQVGASAIPEAPERIGAYKILSKLGEGGMGVVYLAEQEKPIHRRVALKIIKLGMDTKQVIARFETEREALALMNHPNVAKVFDAGVSEQGRPYFAMEHVPGIPITEYCDKHRLSTEERLHLFMDVCNAVQHAHQKGIIHRDIKPSNVLVSVVTEPRSHEATKGKGSSGVSPAAAGAEVKVIDFGVAKATQHRLTEQTLFTEQGQLIGTPGYMSPEQAEMTALDIDTRTDIYSLGVLLYELLVGELPFDSKALHRAGLAEIQRIIREVDPPKPSTKFSSLGEASTSIAHKRHTEPRTLARQLRGDLDWIVMKSLEKDRTRRYDTPSGLAMEIQRFLNHEPVLAGPPSMCYRARKFVRRNRVAVLTGTLFVGLVMAAAIGMTGLYIRAERAREETAHERDRAQEAEQATQQSLEETQQARVESEQARDEACAVTKFLTEMLSAVNPAEQGKDILMREVLDGASQIVGEKFGDRPLIEARVREAIALTYLGLGLFDEADTHASAAARICQRELGSDHETTLRSVTNLASVLESQGKFSGAQTAQERTLASQRRMLGEEHPNTLASMNNLAGVYLKRGRYAEAEVLFRKVLEIRRRVSGDEHQDTSGAMSNLAVALRRLGRYAEAEAMLRTAVAVNVRIHPEGHPQTLVSMGNLATAISNQGRYDEGEDIYRKAIEIQRRVLGEEHQHTLVSMNNLAIVLNHQGKHGAAEELHRTVLGIRRRTLGDNHPETISSLHNLAVAMGNQGKWADAEQIYQETIEGRRRALDHRHPDLIMSMGNLADALGHQGRFAEAEPLLLEAHNSSKNRGDDFSTDGRAIVKRIVTLYESWDAAEPGKGYAEKAAEWRGKLEEEGTKPRSDEATKGLEETPKSQNVETSKTENGETPK